MLFSIPTSRGESCSCPCPILYRPPIQLLQVTLHSEPILHLAHSPSQPAKQTRASAFHHCSASHSAPAQIPKQPTQNPLAVAQVTIGDWALTTACQSPVHWPQRRVSSHPGFPMFLLTVSCKTVWKTFSKSRQLTTTVFFQPTRSVAVSQEEKRLVSGDLLLTNTCQLSCSHPSLQGFYDLLFDCLFHVSAGIQLDYKSLASAVSPCYG